MKWNEKRLNDIMEYLELLIFGGTAGYLKFVTVSTDHFIEASPIVLNSNCYPNCYPIERDFADVLEKILKEKRIKYNRNIKDGKRSRMVFIIRKSILDYKWEDDSGFKSFIGIKKYNL